MTTRLEKSALNIAERSAFLRFSAALAAVLIAVMLRMVLTPLWGPTAFPFFFSTLQLCSLPGWVDSKRQFLRLFSALSQPTIFSSTRSWLFGFLT